MRCFMLWHGGASYAVPETDDAEQFDSLAELCRAFERRSWSSETYYPCVSNEPPEEGGPQGHVYLRDPRTVADPYPDRIVRFGPRGGLRLELA